MSIVAITGDHPRHRYLVRRLAEAGLLSGWVRERRESFVPEPPDGLTAETARLFRHHFEARDAAEARFFGGGEDDGPDAFDVSREGLNGDGTIGYVASCAPRIVLSYGCHKLSAGLREAVGATFWNTHGGLSPEYRGVTTHFWPSFLLEPQMTGMTLHETTDALDGGGIVHQTGGQLVAGDGLHDLAARTVRAYADELPGLLRRVLQAGEVPAGRAQTSTGKLWLSSDWRPEHLRQIYDTWEDRIVDRVLDGTLEGRQPKLISVLAGT